MSYRLLLIGDVVGSPGRDALAAALPQLVKSESIDFCMVNVENSAAGYGMTGSIYHELMELPVDVMSSGNHIYAKKDFVKEMDLYANLVRPLNYAEGSPGQGACQVTANGKEVLVINLIGRVFMALSDCPFKTVDAYLESLDSQPDLIIVDFHAEASSEKQAMGFYLDGRVTAVVGTHTHVQTADNRILPKGSAYMTDLGMTGARDSVIGMKREASLARLLSQAPTRLEPETNSDFMINGLILEVDEQTNDLISTQRVCHELKN